MQLGKNRQIRKVVVVFLTLGILVILGIAGAFFVGAMQIMSERRSERESTANYLVGGGRTRCSDEKLVNGADEFLKNKFQAELDCCISKKRLLKKALESREWTRKVTKKKYEEVYYNEKYNYEDWIKKCSEYGERIVDIINDLK